MKKRCFKCHETLPIGDFYRHAGMADGHLNKCKECTKADVRNHRRTSESVREYDRRRANDDGRKAAAKRNTKTWRKENPEKYQAQTALGNALRDGKIKKEPCYFCRSTDHVHGHHKDYQKPLDVVWLCARCHHRFHAVAA